jgi:hypothetical protein
MHLSQEVPEKIFWRLRRPDISYRSICLHAGVVQSVGAFH